jgi:PIN domain nuclease of toxin-antitoxin system
MGNSPKLSKNAKAEIEVLDNECFVSVISVWEAAIKFRSGRLPEAAPLVEDPTRILSLLRFTALPLQLKHARLAGSIVSLHKDPFDRMIAAQALLDGLTLVSSDQVFDTMLVKRLW